MATCAVTVELMVDQKVVQTRRWPKIDVMRTASTRAWATRRFREVLKDFDRTNGLRNKVITVEWRRCIPGGMTLKGRRSGVKGREMAKTGIFDT